VEQRLATFSLNPHSRQSFFSFFLCLHRFPHNFSADTFGHAMSDDLAPVIDDLRRCGTAISEGALKVLVSKILPWIENNPILLIRTFAASLCELDCPLWPSRVLLSISSELIDVPPESFRPLIDPIREFGGGGFIAPLHNAVFLLPPAALTPDDARVVAGNIVDLIPPFSQSESLQVIAMTLSQFLKKWAGIIPEPEITISSLFSVLSGTIDNYRVLSLLCHSVAYLLIALVGETPLKDLISAAFELRATVLDRCTPVANVPFGEFARQSLPQPVRLRLIASCLLTLPQARLAEIADKFPLLRLGLRNPPRDELGLSCYYAMLSAVLKVSARQLSPKALHMCCLALLQASRQEIANRAELRSCLISVLQCSSHISNPQRFHEMLFGRVLQLPAKHEFRRDALPLLIPNVPFSCITLDFFREVLSLFDSHRGFVLKCVCEIYRNFEVPAEYSLLLLQRLDRMNSSTQMSMLSGILRAGERASMLIRQHTQNCEGLDENRRLALELSLAAAEPKSPRKLPMAAERLRRAVHSWDFEVRLSALCLICTRQLFDSAYVPILFESIPRVFVYCDLKHKKSLERSLQQIVPALPGEQSAEFLRGLVSQVLPLLEPHQSGAKKSYIISVLRAIWGVRPLFMLSTELLQFLILALFEGSYPLRTVMFQTLCLIGKMARNVPAHDALVRSILDPRNHFVKDLIERNRHSDRFREGDGAARLLALVGIRRGDLTFDDVVNEVWRDYTSSRERGDLPSHFPLSVILHFIQGEADDRLNSGFITDKLLPELSTLILDSLEAIGVETSIEATPADRIRTTEPPESHHATTITRTWWVVWQALNIISSSVNRFFTLISPASVGQIGDALFRFLIESKHATSVAHAQQTFQALCARCAMREDCAALPGIWADRLFTTVSDWTATDHRSSNGLVQTALALVRSEPAYLFGSQRPIYGAIVSLCNVLLEWIASGDEVRSALLLAEALASDNVTQANFEPFFSRLLPRVLELLCAPLGVELSNVAKRCLARLFARRPQMAFADAVPEILAFFSDHLAVEQPEIGHVILQMLQLVAPVADASLLEKVVAMRASVASRVRRAAARVLVLLLPAERASHFFRRCMRDLHLASPPQRPARAPPDADPPESEAESLEEMEIVVPEAEEDETEPESQEDLTACVCDGIVVQMQALLRAYPALRDSFRAEICDVCDRFLQKQGDSLIQIFVVVTIAREFDCLDRLRPVLLHLFANRARLVRLPLGYSLLRACLSVLDEGQVVALLEGGEDPTILHLLLQLKEPSVRIASVCIDLFLRNRNEAITDVLSDLLRKWQCAPSPDQRARFESVLFEAQEDARMEAMLSLAPKFVMHPKQVFQYFERFSLFVDRSDSNVLLFLSGLAWEFQESLFREFVPHEFSHWKVALRLISDENSAVRRPCCRALSAHICGGEKSLEVCEYDLIVRIYEIIAGVAPQLLKGLLVELKRVKEGGGESDSREPASFLFPPSFHIDCIKEKIKREKE
jgi:hypothetical protein